MPDKILWENLMKTWWLSWFWWMAFYLYQIHKWERFQIAWFIINVVLAFFVWYITWEFIPDSMLEYKNWLIAISWFITYPLLHIIESKMPMLFIKYLGVKNNNNNNNNNNKQ